MTQLRYWILASLGGGSWYKYEELKLLANRRWWTESDKVFKHHLIRLLESGLIKPNIRSCNITCHPDWPRFGYHITPKGDEALEHYKWMRYHDNREAYRLKSCKFDERARAEAQI